VTIPLFCLVFFPLCPGRANFFPGLFFPFLTIIPFPWAEKCFSSLLMVDLLSNVAQKTQVGVAPYLFFFLILCPPLGLVREPVPSFVPQSGCFPHGVKLRFSVVGAARTTTPHSLIPFSSKFPLQSDPSVIFPHPARLSDSSPPVAFSHLPPGQTR